MTDLDISRLHSQFVDLHLSIYKPNTMLACQVSNPTITKGARVIAYDSVTVGDYTQVFAGMTLLVGTTPGGQELGKVRVRSITLTSITVAENSHINWQDLLYLTVLDIIDITSVFPRIIKNPSDPEQVIFYKDYDIVYTNQNSILGSFVCMGPHRAGMLGDDGEISFWYSASGTQHVNGDSLSYQWVFDGATSTGSSLGTPGYITYNTPGHYTTKLIVTGVNGSVDTSYRYVSIYPNNQKWEDWEISDGQGSRASSGYTSTITLRNPWDYDIYDGAIVVIYSDEYYNGNHINVGGNAENSSSIYFVGYIIQGTIKWSYDKSSVEFQIGSIDEIMRTSTGFGISIENSVASPTTWYQIKSNNVKKSVYHFLRWHSTVLSVADIQFLAEDRYIQYYDTNRESIFDGVASILKSALMAEVVSDFQGKLWIETSMEATHLAKTAYPPITTIVKDDWMGEPAIQELIYDTVSYIELGGIQYNPLIIVDASVALLAAAPGSAPGYYGKAESPNGLALVSQNQLNQLVGDVYAYRNAKHPTINFELAGAYKVFDIAPQKAVQIVIDREDTSRNISINAPYFITGVHFSYNRQQQYLKTSITVREITEGFEGDTVLIPVDPPTFPPIEIPTFPPIVPYVPPEEPYTPLGILAVYINGIGLWFTSELDLPSPFWYAGTTADEWTLAELQSITGFDMNRYGRAFLSSSTPAPYEPVLYSQLVGKGNSKYVIADTNYFLSQIGTGPFGGVPLISAIGVDFLVDNYCAVLAGQNYPNSVGRFFLASASAISPRLLNPGMYEIGGNFTHYNTNWYLTHGAGLFQAGHIFRISNDLMTVESTLNIGGPIYHTRALNADLIYTAGHPTLPALVIGDNAETILRTYPAGTSHYESSACDPTGQYVMTYNPIDGVQKSSDFGISFTPVTMPHSIVSHTIKFVNMGDANTWACVYNQSPSSTIEIQYTPDFGVTWVSKAGNLLDWVPDNAGTIGIKYA